MRSAGFSLFALAICGGLASAKGGKAASCPGDTSIIAHTGTPVGKEISHKNVTLYISKPNGDNKKSQYDTAVLYLTDVFGLPLAENKLLADSFARAGYLTVTPDLFQGDPAFADINTPGFNTSAFLAKHGPDVTDPIVATSIDYLRTTLGVKRIGVTGYCFGGRYAFRSIAPGKGGDAAFAAHPSLLEDSEIQAIKGPASVAAAETDALMPPARRAQIEAVLLTTAQPYQVTLYSGTSHGFGVRANVSVPVQKFGKEGAFLQAVRWFGTHL
ncbi:dienelactone hydrolase [Podospora appendiculata]|uniref:Dienelactone hydrolase n=1 Tax=Podospora appendiculata TaxID=314037 RepID=A0AAE0X0A8_9PEZI|nr:dienelactone hydrolase [Podospora appendiculata]